MDALKNLTNSIGGVILLIAIFIIAFVVSAIPIYYLWNWLMPEIFGLKTITIWQAFGIVLVMMLLKARLGRTSN